MTKPGRPSKPAAIRFHEKYRVDTNTGCWLWTDALTDGYGYFWDGTRKVGAHRFAYELLIGPIPDGRVIDHRCRTRGCVNPAHMEPVAPGVTVLRGKSFAAVYARATHCVNGHEFTPENTHIRKDGRRQCRACRRVRTGKADRVRRLRDPRGYAGMTGSDNGAAERAKAVDQQL